MIDPKMLRMVGALIQRRIKARISQNQVTPKTEKTGATLVKSGILRNSITYRVDENSVAVGTNVKYAQIHHEGGIIRPIRAKYLAIPIAKEAQVLRPRDFENTFIKKEIIFQNRDGKAVALYALKEQVTIPKREYMYLSEADRIEIISSIITYYEKNPPIK